MLQYMQPIAQRDRLSLQVKQPVRWGISRAYHSTQFETDYAAKDKLRAVYAHHR